jgi:hypothetical protein
MVHWNGSTLYNKLRNILQRTTYFLRFSTKLAALMQQFVLVTVGKLGGVINHPL